MTPSHVLGMTPQGRLYLKRYSQYMRGICGKPRLPDYLRLSHQEARELLEAAERFARDDERSRED